MYTTAQKYKWASVRVFYYFNILIMALTGGLSIYVVAPYTSYMFFNDLAFWKYLKYYHKLIVQLYRIMGFWLFDPKYREMYTQPLTSPPSLGPDRRKIKLSAHWQKADNDCGNCINCCIKIKCPLIDHQRKLCLSYNTVYWRYFSCGCYPASQKQIDYYECPKWVIKESSLEVDVKTRKASLI
ncbi:hypothetical protein Desor_4542 [Desulfosporosinus orientis DSM 765]|uniref:Uncharacterized protein n=1 Tax=Desulfosporosinus orientis (strain ATCC 19365 / DSM 765 / NCIMB 8382 / VKM B-1628 / Singapore I) TaxID=768706 RepID=G7W9N1_DESOD|nr:hypothetical protein [Desulfosporosinus orientis]AET69948.1 hypothetical protein Desor_4542 [Desulfosporosinus orientis DSM 765]